MDPNVTMALTTIDQIKFFADISLKGEIPDDSRYYQVAPETAHIHWLVGHVAYAIDRVALWALGGKSEMSETLQPIFGRQTKPVGDETVYPSWDETVESLYDAIRRIRAYVATVSDAQLAQPLPQDHPFAKMIPTRGGMVSFIGFHTCYHLGQLSLLRRAQGLPSGMGG